MTSILEILHTQHEMLSGLFKKIESTQETAEKDKLFTQIKNDLTAHMKGEEKLFYPALEKKEENKEYVLHGIEEHHAAKLFLKELEGMSTSGERWKAKIGVLKDMVEHHVETEERRIFEAANHTLSKEEIEQIGTEFESETRKNKVGRLTRVS